MSWEDMPNPTWGDVVKRYPWSRIDDYNPDHQRSWSALYIEPTATGLRWFLQVKGLGVITVYQEGSAETGRLEPLRVGALEKQQVGYCPSL